MYVSTHKSANMRTVVVNKIVLICSAAKIAYAHPDLQKDAASATPCAFAELLNGEGGLDDVSSSKENTEQHEAEQPSPSSSAILKGSSKNKSDSTVKLSRRAQAKKKKQSSASNIFLPNAIDSGGRNQNQNGGGGREGKKKAQNSRPNQVESEGRNIISPGGCFTTTMYDDIDADVMKIQNGITDPRARGGFLGGILRMAAHDAMDFDPSLQN